MKKQIPNILQLFIATTLALCLKNEHFMLYIKNNRFKKPPALASGLSKLFINFLIQISQ